MAIDKELLDQLLAGRDPKELFSRDGLLDELKKAMTSSASTTAPPNTPSAASHPAARTVSSPGRMPEPAG
jgi:hypothetical protein